MKMTVKQLRRLVREAMEPWMIDAIRHQDSERERQHDIGRQLYIEPPSPWEPPDEHDEIPKEPRGIADIDFTIESNIRRFVREAVRTIDDTRSDKPLPNDLTVAKLKEIFKSVPYEAQEVKKKFAELGFNVKWSRWNDRDGDKLAGEAFTKDGMRYFFEFHDLDPQVGRDKPLLVMFDNSGSSGWVQDDDGELAKAKRHAKKEKAIGGKE